MHANLSVQRLSYKGGGLAKKKVTIFLQFYLLKCGWDYRTRCRLLCIHLINSSIYK